MTLASLFPDEDYRFGMRFERGNAADFFRPSPQHEALIAQRRYWLENGAETYAAILSEGLPLLQAAIEFGLESQTLPDSPVVPSRVDPLQRILDLGKLWEPDFLLLKPDVTGHIRLVAGCVCFPSSWSLAEKIGNPIETIHGVVPGLNQAIGKSIQTFLSRLRPGTAWLRANWGLSGSPELNQHPKRNLPRLDSKAAIEEVWLRIEHQVLTALPRGQGILFGIRIAVYPFTEIQRDPLVAQNLRRALQTIPEEMAQYKNIANIKGRLISWLTA